MNSTSSAPIVLCPHCGVGSFSLTSHWGDTKILSCPVCPAQFAIQNNVLSLLSAPQGRRNWVQYLMELEPVVQVYEGTWWRQNPIFTALTHLSFAEEYQLIVAAAQLEKRHFILDLACGSGIYARPLAHHVSEGGVVGLDLSMPMLTYGSDLARQEGLNNLFWLQGTATALPFADHCFDRVNCCGALHLFPHLHQVLGEVKRILKPQGIFTMAVFRQGDRPFSLWLGDVRRRIVGVQSFSSASLTQLLHQAGFTAVTCHHGQGIWLIMSTSA